MQARPEKVMPLTKAALEAISAGVIKDEGINADEVFSACLSVALNGVRVAIEMGANKERLRAHIATLMLMCAEDGKVM